MDGDGIPNCADPDSDNDGVCDPNPFTPLVYACALPLSPDGACCAGIDNCPSGDTYGRGGTFNGNAGLVPQKAALGHEETGVKWRTEQCASIV